MARKNLVTTHVSNLLHFDRDAIMVEMVEGESEYVILCMRPDERALCLSAINYFAEYKNRWIGGWAELERTDLIARANDSLIKELACSEDIDQLNTTLANMSLTMTEIRDRLGTGGADIDAKLEGIRLQIEALVAAAAEFDPSHINDLEEIFNEISTILGGAAIVLG